MYVKNKEYLQRRRKQIETKQKVCRKFLELERLIHDFKQRKNKKAKLENSADFLKLRFEILILRFEYVTLKRTNKKYKK